MFYPADPAPWARRLDAAFAAPPPCPFRAKMVVVPHAGIEYSGGVAAKALRALDAPKRLKRIVILGPNHRVALDGIALHPAAAWTTPLGVAPVAEDAARAILSLDGVAVDARPFAGEHSLEMALIFVQRLLPGVEIVPVLVGAAEPALVEEAVERLWGGPETAICLSSDLSHFLSAAAARERDDATRAKIERGAWSELQSGDACGCSALRGAIRVAEARGMRATGIAFATSDEAGGPSERVVGYGAFAFEEADAARLADADRARLIAVAAASLDFAAAHDGRSARDRHSAADVSPALSAQRASFVTLERDGRLRGCIGSPAPRMPLARDVARNAVAAGFGDPRFSPLTPNELAELTISISVLSPATPLALADEDELIAKLHPGRDGLILRERGAGALFLPSVWATLPDRRAFVQQLKRKMGRAADHWSPSMRAWRFTTESFEAPFAAAKAGGLDGIALQNGDRRERFSSLNVMAGLDPAIHAWSRRHASGHLLAPRLCLNRKSNGIAWMAGTSPAMTCHGVCALPRQPEARPAFEVDAFAQEEALRPPGGEDARNIGVEQPGDDGVAVARRHRGQRRRQQAQRLGEDVGEHDVVGRALAHEQVLDAARQQRLAMGGDAVEARVGAGDVDCDRVEVAEPDLAPEDFRRGDGEHAGAAADVEDVARPPALQQAIEMQQAAARRAVMAGAEGEAGLDLDSDVVGLERGAVVRAMDEEAPGPTGARPASELATQSRFSVRPNSTRRAASSPAAAATSSRNNSSSGAKPK